MSENNPTSVPATPEVPEKAACGPRSQVACDIATGRAQADQAEVGTEIVGAKKDLNSKGRGNHWYRMVYRAGDWRYVSDDRLPTGSYLASDRRATVRGVVYTGEIVIQHDRGAAVDAAKLVILPDGEGKVLLPIPFAVRRDGRLSFTLPDGSVVVLPDPRAKTR